MAGLAYVDLTELPDALATLFTIDAFTAGVLLTIGLSLVVLVPFTLLTGGEIGYPHTILELLIVVACTVLEWLDPWILLLGVILLAVGFGLLASRGG